MERFFRRWDKFRRVEKHNCGPPMQSLNDSDRENSPRHKVNKPPRSQPPKYTSVQRISENCSFQIISGCSSILQEWQMEHKMEQQQDLLYFPQEPAQQLWNQKQQTKSLLPIPHEVCNCPVLAALYL